jgi:phosphohistidine phosphatase SixA
VKWLIALVSATLFGLCGPFISPANAQGDWAQLREEPGLVVLMRHAIAPGGGDPPGFTLGKCSTQRNLSAEGRTQARSIGREFREQRVPIAAVLSSRWCRAVDTAKLLGLGTTRSRSSLDSVFTASQQIADRKKRQTVQIIRNHRGKSGVLVLVGHQANIIDLTGVAPDSGGAVIVRTDRKGNIKVLGQIPPP